MFQARAIRFRTASQRMAKAARGAIWALGLLGCGAAGDDTPAEEPTGTVTQKTDWHSSAPGNLGMGIIWAGTPTTTGTQTWLADMATDGVGYDKSTLFKTDTGKPIGGQGDEREDLLGYGDFNGDGQTDLLWRASLTRKLTIWEMQGHQVKTKRVSGINASPYFFSGHAKAHIADLNGDCISDIVWTGTIGSPSSWSYRALTWIMQAGSTTPAQTSFQDSANTEVIAVSNFDSDTLVHGSKFCGKADMLKRNSRAGTDGMVSLHTASGQVTNIGAVPTSSGWAVRGVGEFNQDGGGADVLWYNTISGEVSIWTGWMGTMNTHPAVATVPPSWGWTVAGLGDFNGDYRSDIVWQHKANKKTSIWRMNSPTSVGQMMTEQPFLSGATIAGVMNVYDPPRPVELSYSINGGTTTISVRNDNYVKDGNGTTRIEIVHETMSGPSSLTGWDVTGTGFKTKTVPTNQLGNGASTCMFAYVYYHGRYSHNSNSICMANMVSDPMGPPISDPDMRPNLVFPWGAFICTPDGENCGGFYPRVNEEFTLKWWVCNYGRATAPATTTHVRASMNGDMGEAEFDTSEILPGYCEEQELDEPLMAWSEQQVYFGFWADGESDVDEAYEGDNYAAIYETIWF